MQENFDDDLKRFRLEKERRLQPIPDALSDEDSITPVSAKPAKQ